MKGGACYGFGNWIYVSWFGIWSYCRSHYKTLKRTIEEGVHALFLFERRSKMFTRMLPEMIVRGTRKFLRKHGKDLMILGGAIGLCAACVSVAKETEALVQEKNEREEPPTKEEARIMAVKHYWKPATLAAVSFGLVVAGDTKYAKAEASLISTCTLLNERYLAYRNKVIEKIGEECNEDIEMEIVEESIKKNKIDLDVDAPFCVFFDEFDQTHGDNGFFKLSYCEFLDALLHLNRIFAINNWVSLNTFYELLGLEYTPTGEDYGWGMEMVYGDTQVPFIDIEPDLKNRPDGTEYYVIHYVTTPSLGYKNC